MLVGVVSETPVESLSPGVEKEESVQGREVAEMVRTATGLLCHLGQAEKEAGWARMKPQARPEENQVSLRPHHQGKRLVRVQARVVIVTLLQGLYRVEANLRRKKASSLLQLLTLVEAVVLAEECPCHPQ